MAHASHADRARASVSTNKGEGLVDSVMVMSEGRPCVWQGAAWVIDKSTLIE